MGKKRRGQRRSREHRTIVDGWRPVANPALAEAMLELRRSSAASPHTPSGRKGTRSERRRRAVLDSLDD